MHSIIYKVCTLAFTIFFSVSVLAQKAPIALNVSTRHTSVIVFPAAIKSVDRGDGNVLTKTIKEIGNVLKVKAATDSFQCTNMHVFTADGNIYSFEVSYQINPAHLTLDLTKHQQPYEGPVQFSSNRLNEAQVTSYAQIIREFTPVRHRPRSKWKGQVRAETTGIYHSKGILFFQFRLLNMSAIPYDMDFTRCYIRDRKKYKRSSVTEREIMPVYLQHNQEEVAPHEQSIIVLAFDRFTIADNKYFVVELFERNGDRSLSCKLKGSDILKAVSPSMSAPVIRDPAQP